MREIDEFPEDGSHFENLRTKVKDSEEHSMTTEERDEIIRKYNAEHSKHRITSDESEKTEQSDFEIEQIYTKDEYEPTIAKSTKSDHSLLDECCHNYPLPVEKLSERATDEIHVERIDRLNISSDISELTIISQEIDNYLTMVSALSATTILDGILRYGGSGEKLDGQDRLPGREVKYAVPDLFNKIISQLWLVSQGDISSPFSKFVDNLAKKLLDTTGKDSLLSLDEEVALEEKNRLTKSALFAFEKDQNRNRSI
ncbi:MAG: hypothetical protein E4H14_19855, partial [Candidatus Thorarchaeota archaeon]